MNAINKLFRKYVVDLPKEGKVQLVRSLAVGVIATLVDMGSLVVMKEWLGLRNHTVIAATIAYMLGLVTNYLLSTFWAFRGLNTKKRGVEFAVFAVISLIGLGLNNLIIMLFEKVLGPRQIFGAWLNADKYYIIGKVVATVVVFVWNFGMRKLLLYRGKPAAKDGDDTVASAPAAKDGDDTVASAPAAKDGSDADVNPPAP
ncbi:MAG: GtrA family protein [Clostridia bacterium]|nr:GtrA family protein [Clostridia bacterium]